MKRGQRTVQSAEDKILAARDQLESLRDAQPTIELARVIDALYSEKLLGTLRDAYYSYDNDEACPHCGCEDTTDHPTGEGEVCAACQR